MTWVLHVAIRPTDKPVHKESSQIPNRVSGLYFRMLIIAK